jgi:hypothetical protein
MNCLEQTRAILRLFCALTWEGERLLRLRSLGPPFKSGMDSQLINGSSVPSSHKLRFMLALSEYLSELNRAIAVRDTTP